MDVGVGWLSEWLSKVFERIVGWGWLSGWWGGNG